jgi:predicted phosphodiesterase
MKRTAIAITFILLIALYVYSCDYLDFAGMFVVDESINDRFEQSLIHNESHPSTKLTNAGNEYIITVIADVHIGEVVNFNTFLQQSKTMNAVATVLNGDICNGNDYDYEKLSRNLPDTADLKYFMLAGNHDLFFGGWQYFYKEFGSSTYYFIVESSNTSDLFICLDTGSGTLGNKQLHWFKTVLTELRHLYRNCIVFTHNNLYRIRKTESTNPVPEELLVLTDLFARHRVDMVITGHDHVRNVVQMGNTTHITMDASFDGHKNASFLKLTLNKYAINYEFINM